MTEDKKKKGFQLSPKEDVVVKEEPITKDMLNIALRNMYRQLLMDVGKAMNDKMAEQDKTIKKLKSEINVLNRKLTNK